MHDQREILAKEVSPDMEKVPQLWALFTEVQKYYDGGLKVPDDVTLLFTDDNVGNLRRVPTPEERKRAGGSGVYFHMDMNGGPFSYKWLNSNPLPKIWEQMNLAIHYGANRIWIVNVGDIKPLEVPIEFFMQMAWRPESIHNGDTSEFLKQWATRDFGPEHAAAIADLMAKYAKYNASPKPELVKPATFSLLNYIEAERVWNQWDTLAKQAQAISDQMSTDQKDAFYELVLHTVLACGNAVKLNIVAERDEMFAKQGRASTNDEVLLAHQLFARDAAYTDYYNHKSPAASGIT